MEDDFNFEDNLLGLDMALAATEVGVEVLQKCMEYFTSMLVQSMQELGSLTGEDIPTLKSRLERELGLENVMEASLLTMRAAKEVINDFNSDNY